MPPGIIGTIGIFIGAQENLQRTDHARVDRLRIRARADGARGRASRGGGNFVDRTRRRARRRAQLSRLRVHQSRPRPSRLSRDASRTTSPRSCGCSPRYCRTARWPDTVAVVRGDDPFGRRVLDAVKGSQGKFRAGPLRSTFIPRASTPALDGIRATLVGARQTNRNANRR